ncbi:site-specific integrase [Paracoccus sp. S4493]|uniref:site-specific integrase n=1 Tax=Paracoccus sp. S4493 TaxID=579490 RepID=UPI000696BFE2|nr:site-specific integrase [Paracoccus sp. S4493]
MKTPATIEWVRAFNNQAIKDGLPHLGALCVFMFATAARIGESSRLRWGNVDLPRRIARLDLFKPTPWSREAHLPPELVMALANLPSNRKPDELVFDYAGRGSVRGAWSNVCKRAGIERLTLHCCRHGFATSMLHMGFDVKTVADMGGWKDATTVLRTYAHAVKDKTVSDALFDTRVTHEAHGESLTDYKRREKSE